MPGRATIGLYNSYDPVKFHEAHRRAIARAGPIALAFGCNLATFGFPFDRVLSTPAEISRWVASTTSIGESGKYFIELAEKGRYSRFDFPKKGFPPQLGHPVVTTRKPDPSKRVTADELREMLDSGRSILLVFGLGPHGLPKELFLMSKQHLDISGQGLSLETCTAMGAVVGSILGR
ncbi:MAG: DUF531 domain-containing protein [Thermoplasmata archaeon]|nr:DUF531 domain-containing protein [Thermoplasmata archaeon]